MAGRKRVRGGAKITDDAAQLPPELMKARVPQSGRRAGYGPGEPRNGGGWLLGGGGSAYRNASPGLFGGDVAYRGLESANREINRERRQAVINARMVDRNDSLVNAGITKRATNLVGLSLKLRLMPNWRALDFPACDAQWAREFAAAYENEFSMWSEDPRFLCDAERHLHFGGLMHMAVRNVYGADGETMIHIRSSEERCDRYNGDFWTFIEVVDTDRISNPPALQDDRFLQQGRVLDEWGAAVGFHVETRHPSEAIGARNWTLVPRETEWGRPVGVHWYPKHRAGMQRAMPRILQSLRDVKMLDKFDDHTLKAAALSAFMSMYIKSESTSTEVLKRLATAPTGEKTDIETLWEAKFGLYDDLDLVADGQRIPILPPGDEMEFNTANRASDNTESFHYNFERKMASNLGLGTANFTGDYSKTSFASIRAEFMDAWRDTLEVREQSTQALATPVSFAFMEECLARNKLPLPRNAPDFYRNAAAYLQCKWRGPAMGTIDPVKDPTGAGISVAGGFSTPQDEAAMRGGDLTDNIDAIAEAQEYAASKGVVLRWGPPGAATGEKEEATDDDDPDAPDDPADDPEPAPAPAPQE